MRGDDGAPEWDDVDLSEAAGLRTAIRLEGPGDSDEGWAAAVCAAYGRLAAADEAASASAREAGAASGRSEAVTADPEDRCRTGRSGRPRRANVKPGVHILRHTFCSHLAMRGAPARAIQELAGHQDLGTTQRYMHLSPASARRSDSAARWGRKSVENNGGDAEKRDEGVKSANVGLPTVALNSLGRAHLRQRLRWATFA